MWRLVKVILVPIRLPETFRGLEARIGNANHLRIFENLTCSSAHSEIDTARNSMLKSTVLMKMRY